MRLLTINYLKYMVYRVIGKMKGEGQGYVLGFRQVCNLAEWIAKGWKENEITFVRCTNKEPA